MNQVILLEAHKCFGNAKNDVNEYLCGLDENERKNILKHVEVRDYTRSGMCYTLDNAPRPEIELVRELKKICKELTRTTTSQEIHTDHDYYITAKQVQAICGVSETKSYLIIKELNDELKEQGFITIRRESGYAPEFNKRIGEKVCNGKKRMFSLLLLILMNFLICLQALNHFIIT